ncbi:hypothetical protein [Mangrovicella endophytica]|uniref:hypothetical protein n=1 Tax=Mangrovicella endophytica TaxID=2066697 RepID=UPI000C9EA238|nr:hypothetical protein [Mangrovicella endophytica]
MGDRLALTTWLGYLIRTMPALPTITSGSRLPTTLGFSPVGDRWRMPGRFFYRLLVADGR